MAISKILYVLHIDDVEVDMGLNKLYATIEANKVIRECPNMDVWIEERRVKHGKRERDYRD